MVLPVVHSTNEEAHTFRSCRTSRVSLEVGLFLRQRVRAHRNRSPYPLVGLLLAVWLNLSGCDLLSIFPSTDADLEDVLESDISALADILAGFACGNGVVDEELGEVCDDGNKSDADGCLNTCQLAACGDGFLHIGVELCDPGVMTNDVIPPADPAKPVCLKDCTHGEADNQTSSGTCGDDVYQPEYGEGCDPTATLPGPPFYNGVGFCTNSCQLTRAVLCSTDADCQAGTCQMSVAGVMTCAGAVGCGDGVMQNLYEQCDDGANNSDNTPDACRTNCRRAYCGDGVIDPLAHETCDDGNPYDGDGCSRSCAIERCGDGRVQAGESCDDGNNDGSYGGCRSDCTLARRCGDGVQDPEEECDAGAANTDEPGSTCSSDCKAPVCGDGIVNPGEACDDGNEDTKDWCTNTCDNHNPCSGLPQNHADLTAGQACDPCVAGAPCPPEGVGPGACSRSCTIAPPASAFPSFRVDYCGQNRALNDCYNFSSYRCEPVGGACVARDKFIEGQVSYLGDDEWSLAVTFTCDNSASPLGAVSGALHSYASNPPEPADIDCRSNTDADPHFIRNLFFPHDTYSPGDCTLTPPSEATKCTSDARCLGEGPGQTDQICTYHNGPSGECTGLNCTCQDPCVADFDYMYPFKGGRRVAARYHNYRFSGLIQYNYPGIFAPLTILANDTVGQLVAASNWPPIPVKVDSSAFMIRLLYNTEFNADGTLGLYGYRTPPQGQTWRYRAIIARLTATSGNPAGQKAWHVGMDRYRRWLDQHVGPVAYPDWMNRTQAMHSINLQGLADSQIATGNLQAIVEKWKTYVPWVLFWGQMSEYYGSCCATRATMDGRFFRVGPSPTWGTGLSGDFGLPELARKWTKEDMHIGYYSAPDYSYPGYSRPVPRSQDDWDRMRLDGPTGRAFFSSWRAVNQQQFGANVLYGDTISAGYKGDLLKVAKSFENTPLRSNRADHILPASGLYEGHLDINAGAGLVDGLMRGFGNEAGVCSVAAAHPYANPKYSCAKDVDGDRGMPDLLFYLLGDRVFHMGLNNGDFPFWFSQDSNTANSWQHIALRQAFLLGAKVGVYTGLEIFNFQWVMELRDGADWAQDPDDMPRYRDTVGLDTSGIERLYTAKDGPSSLAGIDAKAHSQPKLRARRFETRGGDVLVTIDNWYGASGTLGVLDGANSAQLLTFPHLMPTSQSVSSGATLGEVCIVRLKSGAPATWKCCQVIDDHSDSPVVFDCRSFGGGYWCGAAPCTDIPPTHCDGTDTANDDDCSALGP